MSRKSIVKRKKLKPTKENKLRMRDNKHYRLRRGLDKITLSVYPKDPVIKQFDKKRAKMFEDHLTRKRWGSGSKARTRVSIHKEMGEWDGKPLVQFWMNLSGPIRVTIVLNMMRLYNFKHGLKAPMRIALWDNNLVPPHVQFGISEFVKDLCGMKDQLKRNAVNLYRWYFKVPMKDPEITMHQVELAEEAIGLDVLDVREIYRHTKAYKTVRYSNTTGTVYLNGPRREQFKFYQKGLGVLRGEFTINDSDVALRLDNPKEVEYSFMMRTSNIADVIGIPRDWWNHVPLPEKEELWQLLASTLDLDLMLLKRIVDCDSWQSTREHQSTTRKLLRRGLIERQAPGRYCPSRKLQLFAMMMETLQEPTP